MRVIIEKLKQDVLDAFREGEKQGQTKEEMKNMKGKIFEIRIREIGQISEYAQKEVIKQMQRKPESFRRKYRGFVKITYVSTPTGIATKSVEPIEGTAIDEFRRITDKINPNVFN